MAAPVSGTEPGHERSRSEKSSARWARRNRDIVKGGTIVLSVADCDLAGKTPERMNDDRTAEEACRGNQRERLWREPAEEGGEQVGYRPAAG
jgi:hypothetical protein